MKKILTPLITVITSFALVSFVVPTFVFASVSATTKTVRPLSSFEQIFYYVPGAASFASLQMYQDKIHILAPQSYTIDKDGTLSGEINSKVYDIVRKNGIQLFPLVSNKNFSQELMSTILSSNVLQDKVINQLITQAKQNNFIGWQFDFERILATDRDAYSSFVEKAASRFHAENLHLSVAVIGRTSENPEDLPMGSWDYWAGVYDYARIGKAADSVTLMAYDMPYSTGPVADIRWIKQITEYVLTFIPHEKLSLGIPSYGWVWDNTTQVKIRSVGDIKAQQLLVNELYISKGYDSVAESGWIKYNQDGSSYTLWYENQKSFLAKTAIMQQYNLRGFSLWAIGLEDDAIWEKI